MKWIVPGTVLEIPRKDAEHIEDVFSAMFLAGGIVLSQVSNITGLEPYTVQNWVKRGFLAPPVRKRYTLRQLCRILNINMLKNALPMERICGLLAYVNGELSDESDDLIGDEELYFMFAGPSGVFAVMSNTDCPRFPVIYAESKCAPICFSSSSITDFIANND